MQGIEKIMQNKYNWIIQDLKSGWIAFLLPIFYVLTLSTLNIPPFYLIILFLILIIGYRLRLTRKKRSILTSLGYFILSGIFIRIFIQEVRFVVSDTTMAYTLQINDRVNVDKLIYKFKNPQRGDVIVFMDKHNNIEYAAISRIIGMPNESVEVKNGKIYINGKILENYGRSLSIGYQSSLKIVPNGKYFVQGDTPESINIISKRELVSKDKIIGKVINRFWPIARIGNIK